MSPKSLQPKQNLRIETFHLHADRSTIILDSQNATSASFGDVVRLSDRKLQEQDPPITKPPPPTTQVSSFIRRNVLVAAASIALGSAQWAWRYAHPTEPLSLLSDLQSRSDPLSCIGRNGRPTVVDVWAPWCDTCRAAAPTLAAVELAYGGRVNFVVVNGDTPQASTLISALRVDAIPHVAMIEADGTVSTALIGAVPKRVLEADIDVLLENAGGDNKKVLPYQMLDVFAGKSEEAKRVRF